MVLGIAYREICAVYACGESLALLAPVMVAAVLDSYLKAGVRCTQSD